METKISMKKYKSLGSILPIKQLFDPSEKNFESKNLQ